MTVAVLFGCDSSSKGTVMVVMEVDDEVLVLKVMFARQETKMVFQGGDGV